MNLEPEVPEEDYDDEEEEEYIHPGDTFIVIEDFERPVFTYSGRALVDSIIKVQEDDKFRYVGISGKLYEFAFYPTNEHGSIMDEIAIFVIDPHLVLENLEKVEIPFKKAEERKMKYFDIQPSDKFTATEDFEKWVFMGANTYSEKRLLVVNVDDIFRYRGSSQRPGQSVLYKFGFYPTEGHGYSVFVINPRLFLEKMEKI